MIDDEMIRCWRTNYGLEDNTPAEASAWWEAKLGHAPSGAVAALGTCLHEIEHLQRTLRDHLESEAAETMRANTLRSERDSLRRERDALAATLASTQIAWEDWKVRHSTTRLEAEHVIELGKLQRERDTLRAKLDATLAANGW